MQRPLHLTLLTTLIFVPWSAHAQGGSVPIECGSPPLEQTYCYTANDAQTWTYTAVGTGTLKLVFDRGTIESAIFDMLRIYDGLDATGTLLFEHSGAAANLGPPGSAINNTMSNYHAVDVTSLTGSLFMLMFSDGSIECTTMSTYDAWDWRVFCMDCVVPMLMYTVVPDCINSQYNVEVDVNDMGSSQELVISNSVDATEISVSATGVFTAGPFTSGVPVQLTVTTDDILCTTTSPMLIDPLCPTIICGSIPLGETYCYGANEDMAWAYGISGAGQLRLAFNLGTIESSTFDRLRIYDGPDNQSPLLFEHVQTSGSDLGPPGSAIQGPGNFYYGVDVTSSGPNLYMELTSDGSIHCAGSTTYDPMEWEVSCIGCQAPGVEYVLEADCEHLIYKVVVNVTELSGPLGLQITEQGGGSITATNVGTFEFATFFGLDTTIFLMVEDLDNPGCIYESGPLMYTRDSCVITSCGVDNYTLCYENNEDRWFTYRSEGEYPLAIRFLAGHLLPDDHVTLYNGLVNTGQNLIYSGNNGGNIAGLTANSSNPDHAITLRIRSDAEGSCADGQATVPLNWDVGCGFVAIEEATQGDLNLYPNPSNGIITLEKGEAFTGMSTLRVMDMSGRLFAERTDPANSGQRTTLDLAMLQNGQYILQITTEHGISTRSFQILR